MSNNDVNKIDEDEEENLVKNSKYLNLKLNHSRLRYGDDKEIYPGDGDLLMEYHLKKNCMQGFYVLGELKHENSTKDSTGQKMMLEAMFQDLSRHKKCILFYGIMKETDYPYSDQGTVTKYRINGKGWEPDNKRNVKQIMDWFIREHGYKLKVYDEHTD